MDKGGNESLFGSTVIFSVIAGCVSLIYYVFWLLKAGDRRKNVDVIEKNETSASETEKKKESSTVTSTVKSKKKTGGDTRWSGRTDNQKYNHPWLLTSLKGHSGQVLDMDFACNGKYLASCAEDRTIHLWCTKDFLEKEHKSIRVNVDFDYATMIRWSPDSKAFVINKFNENVSEVYKVEKRKEPWLGPVSKAFTFPKVHEEDLIALDVASTGKFVMTCSSKTDLVLWTLKGRQLTTVDTYLMSTCCAKITPCGRFVVASGFAPDVKVWEVKFNKSGEFQEAKRAFELSGHTSGVYDMAFDPDTSHMATVSKDGTWKLFDIKIEYSKGELPRLKISGKYEQSSGKSFIALSPDAEVVVIAAGNTLQFYFARTGELDYAIDNIYTGRITTMMFDSSGKYILTSGDKFIRVFHNVTGYKCIIEDSKEKLRQKQTSATKERLQKLIKQSQLILKNISEVQS